METQQGEQKAARTKRFIIPSQEPETAPVRSLFQAPSADQPSCAVSSGSYADYIFNKEPKGPERRLAEQTPQGPNTGSESKPAMKELATDLPPQIGKETSDSLHKLPNEGETRTEQNIENRKRDPVGVTTSTTRPPSIASSVKTLGGRSSIVVSTRQRGNPLLKHVRNIPWEFGDIVPDYLLGDACCALFLSLRYHNLNPEYIHTRLKSLGQSYALRVLLVQVDVKDPHFALKELAKICILSDLTLILSWSSEEAARYLETYKCYEQKPADALKEKTDADFMSRMTDCLTTVKSVNKTDSCTLLTTFGTLCDIANASREDLSLCPGLGPQKAKRLFDTLHEPFLKSKK